MSEKRRARSFIKLFYSVGLSLSAHFSHALQCEYFLSTELTVVESVDALLNELTQFEDELQLLIQSHYDKNLDVVLTVQNELAVTIETALQANTQNDIANIRFNLDQHRRQLQTWLENLLSDPNYEAQNEVQPNVISLADYTGFHELKADVEYLVISALVNDRLVKVVFPERLLRELTNSRVSLRVQKELFGAVKNGFVYSSNMKGLKVMTTYESIRFVEAKVVGGEAGGLRIYGCLDADTVNFYFLGQDTRGGSDPNRSKIKKICK